MRSNFISEAKSGIRPLFLLLIVTATICVGQTVHGTIIDGGTRLPTPTPTATPASFAYVTVRTEPDGLYYEANGVIYSSTQTIQVPVPGDISLRAISPQFGPDGTRYLWNRWSDGGDISHVQHFEFSTFYEVGASFRTQYLLTVEQPPCRIGSVTPGTGFMDAGQPFELRAFNVPGSGYLFEHWIGSGNGSYSGRDNPTLMSIDGPVHERPVYQTGGITSTLTATPAETPVSKAAFDYDGDLLSDISVFRPATGNWYLQLSGSGSFSGIHFGMSGDEIAPADYDNDGKTDIAVYRTEAHYWYILNSSDGTFSARQFGMLEDLIVPGDFDGDGRADIAVFRMSNGSWYVSNSSNGAMRITHFGTDGDRPTPGDFDGDSIADFAVFRPSTAVWYVMISACATYTGEQFGETTDRVIQADYDGDGMTDIAVYRPSDGMWSIKQSSTNTAALYYFGLREDISVPADYDGDGKADIAVFRPSDGNWYRINSMDSSFYAYQFGTTGDIPTESAFRY